MGPWGGAGGGSGVGGGGEIAMDGGQHGGLEGSIKSSGSSLTPPPAGVAEQGTARAFALEQL